MSPAGSASAVRSRLSALASGRLRLSAPPPTSDVLLGAERLLLSSSRAALRSSYASLLSSKDRDAVPDAVSTGTNLSVSFLSSGGLFNDMSRNNDVSYYVVGRGGKGVTEDGEEYAWETQNGGYSHCVPRAMVSEEEKVGFASLLMRLACEELRGAAGEVGAAGAGEPPLLGASVHPVPPLSPHATPLDRCLEGQMRSAALGGIDCFLVHLADGGGADEGTEAVREVLRRCERRRVRRRVPNKTGHYVEEEEETEVGFDVPAVLLREGEIHEII